MPPGWRIVRTSNAYLFRDPLPCAAAPNPAKSENPAGPVQQTFSLLPQTPLDADSPLAAALARWRERVGAASPQLSP